MAVQAVEVSWTKRMWLGGVLAASLIAVPATMQAQAQNGEWLRVTPSDGRAAITPASWNDENAAATAPESRRAPTYRSRADSIEGFRAQAVGAFGGKRRRQRGLHPLRRDSVDQSRNHRSRSRAR